MLYVLWLLCMGYDAKKKLGAQNNKKSTIGEKIASLFKVLFICLAPVFNVILVIILWWNYSTIFKQYQDSLQKEAANE